MYWWLVIVRRYKKMTAWSFVTNYRLLQLGILFLKVNPNPLFSPLEMVGMLKLGSVYMRFNI